MKKQASLTLRTEQSEDLVERLLKGGVFEGFVGAPLRLSLLDFV